MSQSQPFLMQAPGCSHIRTSPEAYVLSRNPTAKFTNRMWQPEWKGSSHRQRAVTNRHIMVSMVFRAIPFPQGLVAGPTGVNCPYLVGPKDIDQRSQSERYLYPAILLARYECAAPPQRKLRGVTSRFVCHFAFLFP
jgi:hypothetical protein